MISNAIWGIPSSILHKGCAGPWELFWALKKALKRVNPLKKALLRANPLFWVLKKVFKKVSLIKRALKKVLLWVINSNKCSKKSGLLKKVKFELEPRATIVQTVLIPNYKYRCDIIHPLVRYHGRSRRSPVSDWRVPDTRPDPIIFGNTRSIPDLFSESSGIGYSPKKYFLAQSSVLIRYTYRPILV